MLARAFPSTTTNPANEPPLRRSSGKRALHQSVCLEELQVPQDMFSLASLAKAYRPIAAEGDTKLAKHYKRPHHGPQHRCWRGGRGLLPDTMVYPDKVCCSLTF